MVVSWESSDTSVVKVVSTGDTTADIIVQKPSLDFVQITASYDYAGETYSWTFNVDIQFWVDKIKVLNKKTVYTCGEKFQREQLQVVLELPNGETSKVELSASGTLPKTSTPGKYTRTIKYFGTIAKYSYTVKCATPKLKNVKTTARTTQKITWTKAKGAKGYLVYVSTKAKGKYKLLADTNKTTYVAKNLKPNTTYYYKVKAYYNKKDKKSHSADSFVSSAKTKK